MYKHFVYILCALYCAFISAEQKYPVDISYMVADIKYSQEHGVKICEVQHGALSAVRGDLYLSGGDGAIPPMIADFFTRFGQQKWTAGFVYPPLQRSLAAKKWHIAPSFETVLRDPAFLECAAKLPIDPFSIASYAGIVYADFDVMRNFSFYRKTYPGILFLNAPTFPYWQDKYKMNALFDLNDELKQYKTDWRLYPKKYDPQLSALIQKDMPSEFYVIKPRGEFSGHGVIIVAREDLESALQMILKNPASLAKHADKKYEFWSHNKEDTFIIEKYYRSDYFCFPVPLIGDALDGIEEYHYDGTIRFVFILQYEQGIMTYHGMGGFWKFPPKALEQEGPLNEKRLSCGKPPLYSALDSATLMEVNAQLEKAMLLLYEIMLNR